MAEAHLNELSDRALLLRIYGAIEQVFDFATGVPLIESVADKVDLLVEIALAHAQNDPDKLKALTAKLEAVRVKMQAAVDAVPK